MTQSVKTITDLKALDPLLESSIIVQGYHEAGDGGGGDFFWDSSFNVDLIKFPQGENFGTTIKPNSIDDPSKPGRWRRLVHEPISVKWFGARGDMKGTIEYYKGVIHDGSKQELTLTPPIFTRDDIGKTIVIWKAGTDDTAFITTIEKVIDQSKVTLAIAAPKKIEDAYVAWGTDDTNPIQRAIDLAKETGLGVYLPPGHYVITSPLRYYTGDWNVRDEDNSPYPWMKHGLHMFGAGVQASFLYNLRKDGATIRIDGGAEVKDDSEKYTPFRFQQTGLLKDFHITSTGQVPETTGIDMRATWAYTIQNVHVSKMGSHAIILQNNYLIEGNSDGDACENVYLDNVFAYKNGGWGIIVDAGDAGVSTGFMHIERCKFIENKGGGIQWTGQMGVIERCGIYGNGVVPAKGPNPPSPVSGAYGILVKNVRATSIGLLITGCEIQGNADVQVMVEVGANIKIVQNEFKDDDLSYNYSFPRVDVQVGDGNTDGPRTVNTCVIEDNRIRTSWGNGWGKPKPNMPKPDQPQHTVVKVNTNAVGTVVGKWWTSQYTRIEGRDKLFDLVEIDPLTGKRIAGGNMSEGHTHVKTHLHRDGSDGGHVLLPFASIQPDIFTDEASYVPDTSQWSNYRFRIRPDGEGGRTSLLRVGNPTTRTIGAPLFIEFINGRQSADVTVKFDTEYNVGGTIIIPHGKTISGILLFELGGYWTSHSPWTCEGRPLISPHIIEVNDTMPKTDAEKISHKATYIPDDSEWSSYYFVISQKIKSLKLGKPTVQTVGAQLFLKFINTRAEPVFVTFDNEYAAGKGIILSPAEVVSGIMLLDETNQWRLHTPWSCEGIPLGGKPPTSAMM